MIRWKTLALILSLFAFACCGNARSAPAPMPTGVAPQSEYGPSRPLTVEILAAGHVFHMRGAVLPDEHAAVVAVEDRGLRALFALYDARLSWQDEQVRVVVDGMTTSLAVGQTTIVSGNVVFNLDVPVLLFHGVPYLPVAALPHVLPGRLLGRRRGHYVFDPLVTAVTLAPQAGGGVRLCIACRVPLKWHAFMLTRPRRYVLNLSHVVLDPMRYPREGDRRIATSEVGRIRFGQYSFRPATLRIVIPLRDNEELRVRPDAVSHQLLVMIHRPTVTSHSDEMRVERIVSVRVKRSGSIVRVILKGSGPFQYEWHRLKAPDNRYFLDLPKTILNGRRRHVRVGDGWIDDVTVGQYQKEPVPTVRVLLGLEQPAETRLLTPANHPDTLVLEVHHAVAADGTGGMDGVGVCGTPFEVAVHHLRHSTRDRGRPVHPVSACAPVVCIDPGHGGSDPGAINRTTGLCEKDVTLAVALRLRRILEQRGWHVVMTRTTDRDVTYPGSSATEELSARVRVAYAFHAQLFVSIHCNSSTSASADGSSTHWYKPVDRALASALEPCVCRSLDCPERGIMRNRFYVLAHCRIPSVLIETAFISNPEDARKLGDPRYQQRLAVGIANGLDDYVAHHPQRVARWHRETGAGTVHDLARPPR